MEKKNIPEEWDGLSDVYLYTSDMTEASTSESTKVPVDSTSSPHNTNTGEPFPIRKLIELCQPIKQGIPACYLLPTEKSEVDGNSAVRRWTFGERDKSRTTKTILMIGETGTGKTTLINTMVNFMLGVRWDDRVWFQIIEEDEKKSQTESQTSAITVYELFLETSSSCLRIIDTPGYGDTSSKEFDKHIAAHLEVLFSSEDGIHEMDVVGIVVKSTQNRLTEFQSYIFNAILSVFGKDIENNIAVFITHSDGLPSANVITSLKEAGVPCAKDTGGEPRNFMFNNRQTENREENFKSAWELGQNSMASFSRFLEDIAVKQLNMTQGVLKERKRLEAYVHNLEDAIKMEELKQKEVQQTQSAYKKKSTNNENFSYEIEEAYKAKDQIQPSWWKISKEATCCTICEENCHYPGCWLVKDLSWCSVMKDGRCTVCTGKCPVSAHVKQKEIYVPKTRKVTRTRETQNQQCQDLEKYMEDLQEQLNESITKKADLLEQAYQCIVKLEEIALKRGSTLNHLDFLIEKMKDTGDNAKVQILEELNKDIQPVKRKRLARLSDVLVPEKLTVESVTATSAVVSWSLSHGMEQTPHSFLISYQTEGIEPESISTEAQSTVITGLKPYTEYTVCVSTQLQHGIKSQPASTTVHTEKPQAHEDSSSGRPEDVVPTPIRKLIENCQPIKPGIPACYLLPTEKSDVAGNSGVRRWTFGERDKSRPTKTIVMIGEIGTGKTTLINTMVNYILGVEWENRVWFQITEENKTRKSQMESRTTDVTVYEVFVETSDSCLRIIDTPGYGATDWGKLDQTTFDNFRFLFTFEDGIHEIDAVGLVVKSTLISLTHQYIFDTILSMFGKDFENNIAVFITHSDGLPAANVITSLIEAGVPCAKDTGGEPLHFMFNNRQNETYEEAHEGAYHAAWNLGRDSVKRFLGFLEDTDQKNLLDCTEMSEVSETECRRLEACVSNLKDAIITERMRQEMHLETHKALESFKQKLDNNENFLYEVEEPHKVKVPIGLFTKAMCCPICQENCHYPGCGLVKDLSACTVMKNNRCTVCTGKCPTSAHIKQRKIFKQEIRRVVKKSADLKQEYGEEVDVKKAVEKELNKSKANMSDLLGKAYRCLAKLTHTDSKKDSMSILPHLKFFIEKAKEIGDDDNAQKFEELQKQMMPLNREGSRFYIQLRGRDGYAS